MARNTIRAIEDKAARPVNFLGIGGLKIFRDLVYVMRGVMQEDHRFYKHHGFYDFPQKQTRTILTLKILGLLLKADRKKASRKIQEGIIKQYRAVIEKS